MAAEGHEEGDLLITARILEGRLPVKNIEHILEEAEAISEEEGAWTDDDPSFLVEQGEFE